MDDKPHNHAFYLYLDGCKVPRGITGTVTEGEQPPIGSPFLKVHWRGYDEPLVVHPLMAQFLGLDVGQTIEIRVKEETTLYGERRHMA